MSLQILGVVALIVQTIKKSPHLGEEKKLEVLADS